MFTHRYACFSHTRMADCALHQAVKKNYPIVWELTRNVPPPLIGWSAHPAKPAAGISGFPRRESRQPRGLTEKPPPPAKEAGLFAQRRHARPPPPQARLWGGLGAGHHRHTAPDRPRVVDNARLVLPEAEGGSVPWRAASEPSPWVCRLSQGAGSSPVSCHGWEGPTGNWYGRLCATPGCERIFSDCLGAYQKCTPLSLGRTLILQKVLGGTCSRNVGVPQIPRRDPR